MKLRTNLLSNQQKKLLRLILENQCRTCQIFRSNGERVVVVGDKGSSPWFLVVFVQYQEVMFIWTLSGKMVTCIWNMLLKRSSRIQKRLHDLYLPSAWLLLIKPPLQHLMTQEIIEETIRSVPQIIREHHDELPNHHDVLSWWSDDLLEHPPQRTTGGSLKPVLPPHDEQKAQAKNVWNIRNTYDIYLQKFWNMTIIRKNLKITYAAKFNPNPSIIHASSCQEVCGSMAKMGRSWSKAVWIQLDWA